MKWKNAAIMALTIIALAGAFVLYLLSQGFK